jgi:uncharacterized spore protein YtfJ
MVAVNLEELMEGARDAINVKRVYGDPYEKDGIVFIPAASVRGGGGGGEGEGEGAEGEGSGSGVGGGFGVSGRPVGAYQIKDGEVTWVPAADTTRVVIMGQVVGIVALLVLRSIFRRRRKR